MKIYLNGDVINCREKISLRALFDEHGIDTDNIAAAINETVIPRDSWETTILKENEKILIIKATHGG